LNILHVIDNLDPATGGPAAVAMRLAAGQAHLGHCLQVLSYATPLQSAAIAASFERVPGIDRIARTELPPLTRIELLLQKRARAKLHQIVPNVDWLYLHGVWNPILKTAADVSQYNRKPYFVLPHGMLDPWSLAQKRWKKRLALATGYRRMLDRATALHLLNEDERTLIGPLRLKPPAVIIPNGVFEEELALPAATPSFFEMFPSLQGRPFILFLGRLHKKKGLDLLSSAFAIIAQQDATVQLVVAGPEGNASAQFDQDIAAAGLGDRVHRI
jgi:glycosyltransferase involved in cell wall biosynthesis